MRARRRASRGATPAEHTGAGQEMPRAHPCRCAALVTRLAGAATFWTAGASRADGSTEPGVLPQPLGLGMSKGDQGIDPTQPMLLAHGPDLLEVLIGILYQQLDDIGFVAQ